LLSYTGWPQKSKPLPNNKQIVINRIKACQLDWIYSSIKVKIKQYNIIRYD